MPTLPKRGVVKIIGGRWKRTPLAIVDAPGLRPTPDRVRKTVFDWLAHALDQSFEGVSVLDLYAGSGALGLEAASRGASPVQLVERDKAAAAQLRAVVARLAAGGNVVVHETDARVFVATMLREQRRFDLVLLDPPFANASLEHVLQDVVPICHRLLYVEAPFPLDRALVDRLGLTMRRSAQAGAVFYHLLQRKNNEETGDASSDLSGDVRPSHART